MKKIALSLFFGFLALILSVNQSAAADGPEAGGGLPARPLLLVKELFRPTPADKTGLAAAPATAGENGYLTNSDGVSACFGPTDRPVAFTWTGPVKKNPAAAGPTLADGYGEMAVQYAGDPWLLQRYKGELKNGLRHGHGELLARDDYLDNAYFYSGNFVEGHLEGRGIYINNDFNGQGGAPFIYEGEFKADAFHGQGVMTDLASGRIIHLGLWFEGSPYHEGPKQWAKADRRADLELAALDHQSPPPLSGWLAESAGDAAK
jgi:hypothetical protein